MSDIKRRLDRLTGQVRLEPALGLEEERKRIRKSAEHANHCGWGEEDGRGPLFEIDERGNVFCTHDEKPVTDDRQILAESLYWMEVGWGSPELVHDEEAQAFYRRSGEFALSRNSVNLQHLLN